MSEWYCIVAGVELGPKSADQIRGMARTGALSESDQVRKGVTGRWVPAFEVKGLFDRDAGSSTTSAAAVAMPSGKTKELLACNLCGDVTPWMRTKKFYLGKTVPAKGYQTLANASTGELHLQYVLLREWDVNVCRECLTHPTTKLKPEDLAAANQKRSRKMRMWGSFGLLFSGIGTAMAVLFAAITESVFLSGLAMLTALIAAGFLMLLIMSDSPRRAKPEEFTRAQFQKAAQESIKRNRHKDLTDKHVICDEEQWDELMKLQDDGVFES